MYKYAIVPILVVSLFPTFSCAQSSDVDGHLQNDTKVESKFFINPLGMECDLENDCLRMQEDYEIRDIFRASNQTDSVTCNGSEVIVKQS